MKVTLILLAVLALAYSAPKPRKLFHEHFDDFIDIITDEAGEELDDLLDVYLEFDEYWVSINYMLSNDFKELVYEMEALPEFRAVIEFLENDNIDILYYIDWLNAALEENTRRTRQGVSGRDFSSFVTDSIALFPKAKLLALFEQKMEDDVEFKTAIDNLQSEEWDRIWNALWENETFQAEAQILAENGIDLRILLEELMAVFGLN